MSLFGSLQTASNTLQAMQIGLQVVNNNIANANTAGYIREETNFAPAPVQQLGRLTIGLGVQVESITQSVDNFLGEQLRDATGDRVSAEIQSEAYKDLERLLGELTGGDLSTAITNFFGGIEDTLNAVAGDTLSVRNLAVLEGRQLASELQRVETRAKDLRNGYDDQIRQTVDQVNLLSTQVAELNVRITQVEGGGSGRSQAGALRSARNDAIGRLTELVNATVAEQPSGGLSVSVGGEFLVFEGQRREVALEGADGDGESASRLVFADTGKELAVSSGRVFGLASARDGVIDAFRANLDDFAGTLIHEFNRAYSQGQGVDGFTSLTSQSRVSDPSARLDAAGLSFAPENGSFDVTLVAANGSTTTTTIDVRLIADGAGDGATLEGVAAQIDAIDGLSAGVNSFGQLTIATDSADAEFTFGRDTSGLLASIGLNTFFVGSGTSDINTNPELDGIQNAGKLALSLDGLGGTTRNAVELAALIDKPLAALNGGSIVERYDQVVNELAQNSTAAGAVAEGLAVFESTLATEFQGISGVNIDEEAIDLISLQRVYQATARVVQTIQAMLDTLVNL